MEAVRAFFADRYGVEATGFTVLTGTDIDALDRHHRRLTGLPLVKTTPGWVEETLDGKAVLVLPYPDIAGGFDVFASAVRTVPHEYFHVLQGTLINGDGYTGPSRNSPVWLVEGLAVYADYLYSQSEDLVRTVLLDVALFEAERPDITLGDLRQADQFWYGLSQQGRQYVYGVGLAVGLYLNDDDGHVEYWKLLGQGMHWEQAFLKAFGTSVDDLNAPFIAWLPSRLPQEVQLAVNVSWPGMGNPALPSSDNLSIGVNWLPGFIPQGFTYGNWGGTTKLTMTFEVAPRGEGYVCLKWNRDVVGWYSDGALVASREDAELIEFTGEDITLKDWSLPGHPDTLETHANEICA